MKPLFALGLGEAARGLAQGLFTAEDLAADLLARTRLLEDEVRAWVWLDEAMLLEEARAADRRRTVQTVSDDPADMLPAEERGSLAGVPVGVKDLIDVHGMPTGMGSPVYADYRPPASAALVDRLLRHAWRHGLKGVAVYRPNPVIAPLIQPVAVCAVAAPR